MKFLADMGISPRTVEFLRDLGHDAVHLHELGLERLPDSQVLRKARNEKRILLTHDLDFAEKARAQVCQKLSPERGVLIAFWQGTTELDKSQSCGCDVTEVIK